MKNTAKLGIIKEDNRCKSINMFLTPVKSDVGVVYTLHIDGIANTDAEWGTWVWQYADKYTGIGYNTNPAWVSDQTGGTTYIQTGDDYIIRAVLTIGNCNYYSDESGYATNIIGKIGSGLTATQIVPGLWELDNTNTNLDNTNANQGHFVELYNIADDSTSTLGINTAQFTDSIPNGSSFTADVAGGTITVNISCMAKIHYTTSVNNTGAVATSIEGRVIKSSTPINNSITISSLDSGDTKVLSKTLFAYLIAGDVLSFEVQDSTSNGIKLYNTNFSVEYVIPAT